MLKQKLAKINKQEAKASTTLKFECGKLKQDKEELTLCLFHKTVLSLGVQIMY